MMESKVFADNFSRSFSESGDFFQFLSARQARSKWMTAPSKELRFEPVERGSTLGNLYMQIYDHNGDADVLEDTMENIGMDTCYTCWLEECLTTNCLGCKRGNYPDCKWIDLKKSYQEEDK